MGANNKQPLIPGTLSFGASGNTPVKNKKPQDAITDPWQILGQMLLKSQTDQQADPVRPAEVAAAMRNDPYGDAVKARDARLAQDPWGPGGQFTKKLTDPAIRASQGRTAENQWAMMGNDPLSLSQQEAGAKGMEGADLAKFISYMDLNNPARRQQREMTMLEQKSRGSFQPQNPGRVLAVDTSQEQQADYAANLNRFPKTGSFEVPIPGTATAAKPAGDWWTGSDKTDLPPGARFGDEKSVYFDAPFMGPWDMMSSMLTGNTPTVPVARPKAKNKKPIAKK